MRVVGQDPRWGDRSRACSQRCIPLGAGNNGSHAAKSLTLAANCPGRIGIVGCARRMRRDARAPLPRRVAPRDPVSCRADCRKRYRKAKAERLAAAEEFDLADNARRKEILVDRKAKFRRVAQAELKKAIRSAGLIPSDSDSSVIPYSPLLVQPRPAAKARWPENE